MSRAVTRPPNTSPDVQAGARDWGAVAADGSWALLFALVAMSLAAALGTQRELTLDEFHTWHQTRLAFGEFLEFLRRDVHPPLYLTSAWLWARVAGDSPMGLRSLSVLYFGLGVVAVWWTSGQVHGARRLGLIAAALYACAPVALAFAAHARSYALLALIATLFVGVSSAARAPAATWRSAVGSGVLAAALFYTHYVGLFVAAGTFLAWSFEAARRAKWRPVFTAVGVAGALALPWLPTLLAQRELRAHLTLALDIATADSTSLAFGGAASSLLDPSVTGLALEFARIGGQLGGVIPYASRALLLLSALPLLGVLALVLVALGRGVRPIQEFGMVAVTVMAGAFALKIVELKFFTVLLPLAIVAFAGLGGTIRLSARVRTLSQIVAGALGLAFVLGSARLLTLGYRHPFSSVVEAIRADFRPGDVVVLHTAHAEIPFEYYSRRADFRPTVRGFPRSIYAQWNAPGGFSGWSTDIPSLAELDAFVKELCKVRPARIWLVLFETHWTDPQDRLTTALGDAFGGGRTLRSDEWSGALRLVRFTGLRP